MIKSNWQPFFMPPSKKSGGDDIIPAVDVPDNQNNYKQTITYDESGNILRRSAPHKVSQNGSGFVISYTDKMLDLLRDIKSPSALKIFLYIAHNQGYGNPIYGYRCTKKHLSDTLNIERTTVWDALNYLRDKFLVLETRIDGQSEFMVNPSYITIGANKQDRLREWSRRWEQHFKSTGGK